MRPSPSPIPAFPRSFGGPESPRPDPVHPDWVPTAADPGPGSRWLDRPLRWVVRRCFPGAPLRFVLADGTDLSDCGRPAVATVVLEDRRALLRLLWNPEARFGEGYASGRIEVQGNLVAGIESAYGSLKTPRTAWPTIIPSRGPTVKTSRRNVHEHYDLGNDFYRLWLDEQMVYTCAYFPTEECSLEDAQVAKMDRICRKLRLRPNERVVEAGCGWGALALHMARGYGVTVKAYNLSREQVRHARRRAESEGLGARVEFIEDDYRNITGRYDAFVSVGMLEHVGLENFGLLAAVLDRSLEREGGRGLLHFIGRDRPLPLNRWIRDHVFPGAYPPTLGEAIDGVVGTAGLSVVHVENMRSHYAKTLAHWRARFENEWDEVRSRYGLGFARTWRLYLAGSEAAFRTGWLQLFQVVFARNGQDDALWDRGVTRGKTTTWRAVTS